MFYKLPNNLTPRARQVFALAQREAVRLRVNSIDTEHVLLGLMKLGQGNAAEVLQKSGINYESLRAVTEKRVGVGADNSRHPLPHTERVEKVLAFAVRETKSLNHTHVGTEHIFIGLLQEGDGNAVRVLRDDFSLDVDNLRAQVIRDLGPAAKDEVEVGPPIIKGFAERLIATFDWNVTDLGKPTIEAVEMTMRAVIVELRHMRPHESGHSRVLAALDRALIGATSLELVTALAEGYKHLLGDKAGGHLRKLLADRSPNGLHQRNVGTAVQVLNDGKPVSFEVNFMRKWEKSD